MSKFDPNKQRDINAARFGYGPLVGRTGDPFIDDPFFNPWAPDGSFNTKSRAPSRPSVPSSYHHNEKTLSPYDFEAIKQAMAEAAFGPPQDTRPSYAQCIERAKKQNAWAASAALQRIETGIDQAGQLAQKAVHLTFNETRRKFGLPPTTQQDTISCISRDEYGAFPQPSRKKLPKYPNAYPR